MSEQLVASEIRFSQSGRNVRPLELSGVPAFDQLSKIGIDMQPRHARDIHVGLGMDAGIQNLTATVPSVGTPVQFLQTFMPGLIRIITAARLIDEITGVAVAGNWEDAEVIQGILENTGKAVPYGDYTQIPFADWNLNYERRNIVRFEDGVRVGLLEEARTAKMQVSTAAEKREGAAIALDISRNSVGFYGYNNALNRTYGLLNDPSLGAYASVATGASGQTTWQTKTYLEITADIRTAMATLRQQSQGNIDPRKMQLTLVLPVDKVDYLSIVSQYGNSVENWIQTTYPNLRVVAVPEFVGANGGADIFYLFADMVQDRSTDGGRTWVQILPTRFRSLGVERHIKEYIEDYSNATAGVMCKRPYAVVRYTGI